jgi:hypothetical protein
MSGLIETLNKHAHLSPDEIVQRLSFNSGWISWSALCDDPQQWLAIYQNDKTTCWYIAWYKRGQWNRAHGGSPEPGGYYRRTMRDEEYYIIRSHEFEEGVWPTI